MRTGFERIAIARCWVVACVVAAGCSAVVDPDVGKLGGRPLSCTPNQRNPCVCQGGAFGSQVCNSGGSYNLCDCGTAGAGGGSTAGSGGSSGNSGSSGSSAGNKAPGKGG